MSGPIITRLEGGLGNQMFQYAAGRRLALIRSAKLKLDLSAYEEPGSRLYDLGHFAIQAEIAPPPEVEALARKKPFYQKKTRIRERDFAFEPRVLNVRPPAYLRGWWQSERYFADVAEQIRKDLQVLEPPSPENEELLKEIVKQPNAVAAHVRRGDYLANNYHANLTIDYYRKGAEMIVKEFPNAFFYLFSDEPEWVQANLKLPYGARIVSHNDSARNYEDLRLMNNCRHFIIANSSFSWWGAWLSQNEEKTVYAPATWFTDPAMSTRDLLPSSWRRI